MRTRLVARMSAATCGNLAIRSLCRPAYRYAHAGYEESAYLHGFAVLTSSDVIVPSTTKSP